MLLRAEDLDKFTSIIAHRTCGQILAAFKTANLVSAWSNHAIDRVVVTDDALQVNITYVNNISEHNVRARNGVSWWSHLL